MKDLIANPDVAKLARMWRRNSRGARLVQEYFDGDATAAMDFLNSFFTASDFARDLAQEPLAFRRQVLADMRLAIMKPKGDC